jgi:prepilin peptidase CpaA
MQELNIVPELIAKVAAQPLVLILVVALLTAAVIDWRTYRIPNWLTVSGMLIGLVYNTVARWPDPSGFLLALAGLAVGLVVLLPVYALRVMGAGDVKLMAMVGAMVGLPDILWAVLYSLAAGGVAALAFAVYHRAVRRMTGNVVDIVQSMTFATLAGFRPSGGMPAPASIGKLPYGVSIAAGTIAWLAARLLGLA